jgi:hypothetical protein
MPIEDYLGSIGNNFDDPLPKREAVPTWDLCPTGNGRYSVRKDGVELCILPDTYCLTTFGEYVCLGRTQAVSVARMLNAIERKKGLQ